jgi:hypothetical protein
MLAPAPPATPWNLQVLEAWAVGFLVLGIRLALFNYGGSPLPYYDQWMAEYGNFLLPLATNPTGAAWSLLLVPHNEHLLLTTKLLTLLGFWLNGYWDVEFLAICAAVVRAAVAFYTYRLIAHGSRGAGRIVLWVACTAVLGSPLSAYNVLCGMQVSFYFVDLTCLASLWIMQRWNSPVASGVALCCTMAVGIASMGSAVALPAVTLVVHLIDGRKRIGFWAAWATTVIMAIAYTSLRAPILLKAGSAPSVGGGAAFFLQLVSWPIGQGIAGLGLIIVVAVCLWTYCRRGAPRAEPIAQIAGLGIFGGTNALLLAVQRNPETLHMRHWEALAWTPLAVVALLVRLPMNSVVTRRWVNAAAATLTVIYLTAALALFFKHSEPYLAGAHANRQLALDHYRAQILSKDLFIEGSRMGDRLVKKDYSFFDDPIGRFNLHPQVALNMARRYPEALSLLSPELVPARQPSATSTWIRWIKRRGILFVALGLALGLALMARGLIDTIRRPVRGFA